MEIKKRNGKWSFFKREEQEETREGLYNVQLNGKEGGVSAI